mmetsp:Transcript_7411/g.16296  ORF Transcript_7411/g.16296 Transcript_7411/m.16296 type:complete len:347 (-) Transcript_7411:168-1208(-)|eukprot:CAMPEP_0178444222 /NCGR_PEP_ID=MMETSP0689_2-20121128/39366_1 /TAXON_ID=160604 /ORGANISM="Amphidinium massartii, Strain CS-259" /LENGTH=346 /DNA_ID=CAMNT_0020068387 /DNA_START=103 /DNA_END=1143 /DNA_ORIENTATION=+
MKSLRERRKNMGLKVETKSPGAAAGKKSIVKMSPADVAKTYRLKTQVMESTNTGMEVIFADRLSDGVEVVIKTREKATSFRGTTQEREWRSTTECQMNMPKMDNLCEYIEVLETDTHYYIVMEKVQGRDLFEQMAAEYIPQNDAREIIKQILDALKSMHSQGRIHKDLKLENVVVDMDSPRRKDLMRKADADDRPSSPVEAKLIDFDTVVDWEPQSPKAKDVLGTDGYIAPEAYGGEYSPASDIYCVGVIMYKMLTRKFPSRPEIFDDAPGENWVGSPAMKRIQERLKNEKIDFTRKPFDVCTVAADLCEKMLKYNPAERPSAEDALAHEWFKTALTDLQSPTRVR